MNKEVVKGFFVGLIAPVAAFVVYVAFCTEDSDPLAMYKQIVVIGKLTHVISLSLLINLLVFFMNLRTNRENIARGILFATICYGFTIVVIKLL